MRCQEVRRRLAELSLQGDTHDCGMAIRAHIAGCPACAQHVQAQGALSVALREIGASDHTDGVPLSAVRALVESRVAQIRNQSRWSMIMSRMARSFTRPAYLIPSVVAVVAVLALTLFPWKVDNAGGYKVAFAGVDKDLALQHYGVQRVLDRLGIANADVEVGDCEASCNLTIKDLRDEADVGKVVSVMLQLSDCQVLGVEREGDPRVYDVANNEFVTCTDTVACCQYLKQLSEDDLEQINVVVREVRLGDCSETDWVSSKQGHEIQLMAIKDCSIPCSPVQDIEGWSDEAAARGDTIKLVFGACGETDLKALKESVARSENDVSFGTSEPQAKLSASSAPIGGFQLNQNYPNPFNASTTITFTAPDGGGDATLEVYNIRGQLVKTLVDRNVEAGQHEFTWDGTDTDGNSVASGIYLYRLKAGDYVQTKKMSLLK